MAKNWIGGAIKHPGAERQAAARAGESTHAYMEDHKDSAGTAGKRARLGLELENMHHSRNPEHSHNGTAHAKATAAAAKSGANGGAY